MEAFYIKWEIVPAFIPGYDNLYNIIYVYKHLYILPVIEAPKINGFLINKTLGEQKL